MLLKDNKWLFRYKIICCGGRLESPQRGDSNRSPQHMILWCIDGNHTKHIFYNLIYCKGLWVRRCLPNDFRPTLWDLEHNFSPLLFSSLCSLEGLQSSLISVPHRIRQFTFQINHTCSSFRSRNWCKIQRLLYHKTTVFSSVCFECLFLCVDLSHLKWKPLNLKEAL